MMAGHYQEELKKPNEELPPATNYRLDHVHGTNYLRQTHSDTFYALDSSTVVFAAGSLCVVHKVNRHRQSYFQRHTDHVMCLTVSKDKVYAASGDTSPSPCIYVWKVDDPSKVQACIRETHSRAIASVDFSNNGRTLVAAGRDAVPDDQNFATVLRGHKFPQCYWNFATILYG